MLDGAAAASGSRQDVRGERWEYQEVLVPVGLDTKHLGRLRSSHEEFWTQVWFECEPTIVEGINKLSDEGWDLTETSIGSVNLVWHDEQEGFLKTVVRTVLFVSIVGWILLPFIGPKNWEYIESARLHFRRAKSTT